MVGPGVRRYAVLGQRMASATEASTSPFPGAHRDHAPVAHDPIRHDQKGASFVEFIIVFPFLFLLVFGAIEFSRMMRLQETMTTLTREAAKTVYRRCLGGEDRTCAPYGRDSTGIPTTNVPDMMNESEICLLEELGAVLGIAGGVNGIAARIAIFTVDSNTTILSADVRLPPGLISAPDVIPIMEPDFGSLTAMVKTPLATALLQNNRLVVAEIWWRYSPLIPFFSGYNRTFHNVSIH